MTTHGYNPKFYSAAQRRRALAEMRRKMREEEARAQALVRAARDAADAILASAREEARIIMVRAYDVQARPKRPVAEIIAEVARERGIPATALRGCGGTRATRDARRAAILRAAREREDLSAADLARIFGQNDASTVRRAIAGGGHG
jgi:chromosomal replication initiation ATPase DnaA